MTISQSNRALATFALLIGSVFSGAASADDDRNRGRDRGGGREFEEKYRDGNCLVERKLERNGKYKEVRECKGVQASSGNRGGHEFDEQFRDGKCIVKRKLERDGDYKEERECEGYDRRHYDQRRTVVVRPVQEPVYPPWVVIQQGRPVYRQGRRPDEPPVRAVSCKSETVGRILGGIAGGVLGAQVGDGNNRRVATIGGSVIGVLIGGEVGRRIDAADQACIGQTLEFARDGQRVVWPARSGTQYAVQPGRVIDSNGRECRPYQAEVRTKAGVERVQGTACRRPDGVWVNSPRP